MNYKIIGKYISNILGIEALFMIPALVISAALSERGPVVGFIVTIFGTLLLALFLRMVCKDAKPNYYAKEGLVCVGLSWIFLSLMGCMPFYISGEIPNWIDAFFETVSGFTTTGASILPEVESLSKGILYWRSFTHWLGGMGILVFLLALAPTDDKGKGFSVHLLRAESPGPEVSKLVPHIRDTAKILYLLYIGLTVLDFLFLIFGKMSVFDAVCTAFGTAGTGGFGVRNDSIASYSPYLQNVCTVFMILFGVNFSCYYLLMLRQVKRVFKDEEVRLYFGVILGSIALIVWNLRGFYGTLSETVRHAAFQVASIMTTTGFATVDFDLWPSFSKAILLFLMVIGACAGSTGGGMKCGRVLLLIKSLKRNLQQAVHPNKVTYVRSNGNVMEERIMRTTDAYLVAYVIIVVFSFLLISLDGLGITTNFSAVLACFNNIGPGLEAVGPTCNYSVFGAFSKLVLIVDMLAGRLEIFPILVFFTGAPWRKS